MQKSFSVISAVLFLLVLAAPSYAAFAQESTQLANKFKLIEQLEQQIRSVENQLKMITTLSEQMKSGLEGANSLIMEQFNKVLDIWKKAGSLTHATDDFEDLHKKRHPEYKDGEEVNVEAERRRRDKEWKEMVDAYLKGLHMNAKDLENRQKAREQMFEVLQSAEGQLQAIQALGALINHATVVLERNGEIVSSIATSLSEKELDKQALTDNVKKNMEQSYDHMKNIPQKNGGHKIDLDSM